MKRPNYYEILEELSKNAYEAVNIVCRCDTGERTGKYEGTKKREKLCELRVECDKMICSLEDTLFSDFIPPLERDNIASLAHSFRRIISRATEHNGAGGSLRAGTRQVSEEEALCVELAKKLFENTCMLRNIRNPQTTPALTEFREMLRRGTDAHNAYLARINSGSLPQSCALVAFSVARIRREISRCFDELIEVMLGNI